MDQENNFKQSNSQKTDGKKVRYRKQLFIYLFFLLVSVIFWYVNALGKTYETSLYYTVNTINQPKGKVLVSDPNFKLTLKAKGLGFYLFQYKLLSYFKTVNLDLKAISNYFENSNSTLTYQISSNYIISNLNSSFPNIKLIGIVPDTLFFQFTTVEEKIVPVKPILNIEFEKSYMLSGNVVVIPEKVKVTGPRLILDTLNYIYTQPVEMSNIKDTTLKSTQIVTLNKLQYAVAKVRVFIPVEKYTEVVYSIPIEVQNVPDNIEVKLFPSSVNLSFNVTLSNYNKVNPLLFKAVVDYSQIQENKTQKLKVYLSKITNMADEIKFFPKSVEYIVEKW